MGWCYPLGEPQILTGASVTIATACRYQASSPKIKETMAPTDSGRRNDLNQGGAVDSRRSAINIAAKPKARSINPIDEGSNNASHPSVAGTMLTKSGPNKLPASVVNIANPHRMPPKKERITAP